MVKIPFISKKDDDKPKQTMEEKIKDFFIPRNMIDVAFIVIAFILAWYAISYDIPNAKVPVICADYWNKWAAEKAMYLGYFNPLTNKTEYMKPDFNMSNFSIIYNITIPENVTNR